MHPTKAEIRFREPGRIFGLVEQRSAQEHLGFLQRAAVFPNLLESSGGSRPRDIGPGLAIRRGGQPGLHVPQAGEPLAIAAAQTQAASGAEPALLHVPLLRLVGQIGRTYLVAEGPDGLYLIDQHAAHERVLFERLLNKHTSSDSQYLLEPVVVQVPGQMDADLAPSD